MTTGRFFAIGLLTMLAGSVPASAFPPGFEARIAGAGPDGKYFLAKDVEAAIVVEHRAVLEFLKSKGEPGHGGEYHFKDVLRELGRVRGLHDEFEKAGRIVEVPYNLPVTSVEAEQTAQYALFSDPAIAYGKEHAASVTKVRADDGPEKGKELYAGRLVPRKSVIVTDRAWLRATGMKRIPAAQDAKSANAFWKATLVKDEAGAAKAFKEGRFKSLEQETECTVTEVEVFDSDHYILRIRIGAGATAPQYWVPSRTLSPEPPAVTTPKKPFVPKNIPSEPSAG
jgi:hypothetical protein